MNKNIIIIILSIIILCDKYGINLVEIKAKDYKK